MNTTLETIAPAGVALARPAQIHRPKDVREADAVSRARACRDRIIPSVKSPQFLYGLALANLKNVIERAYGSQAIFCEAAGIDKFHLAKCWPASTKTKVGPNYKQVEMGVGLYSRCCLACGLLDNCEVSDEQLLLSVSLLDYIRVNNFSIMRSIVHLCDLAT